MAGMFVTFEGLDGSGKSTHLDATAAWLRRAGVETVVTHEPGGTALGDGLRTVFLDPASGAVDGTVEALIVFASRRQHLIEVIDPALAAGKVVLCDRFTDSTMAYQGYGRGVALETLAETDRLATGGRVPDRTLLFDLPAELAFERGQGASRRAEPGGIDRLDAEELEFYRRVRDGYLALAEAAPERFRTVDSSGSRRRTERQVRTVLDDLVAAVA